jgi:hypothetical protein
VLALSLRMGVPIRRLLAETSSADLTEYLAMMMLEHESSSPSDKPPGADVDDFKRAFNL